MPIVVFPLQPALLDGPLGIELLFVPTRTVLRPLVVQGSPMTLQAAVGDNGLVARVYNPAHGTTAELRRSSFLWQVAFVYDGEPPRLVGQVSPESECRRINEARELRNWIAQRLARSSGCPASLLFLRLDLESDPRLMMDWSSEELDRHFNGSLRPLADRILPRWTDESRRCRAEAVREVGRALNGRLQDAPFPDRRLERMEAGQRRMFRAITDIFRRLVREEFGDRTECVGDAFERFAAGMLRQHVSPDHPQLRWAEMAACDADSDAVFSFAELAFMAVECAEEEDCLAGEDLAMAEFWRTHLNALVRMQEVYLARWGIERYRRTLGGFGLAPAVLRPDEYARITEPIRELGDDPVSLRKRVVASLRSLLPRLGRLPGPGCHDSLLRARDR